MPDFRLLGGSLVFTPDSFNAWLGHLPEGGGAWALAHAWDGRVVDCALPEVFKRGGTHVMRVPLVLAALGKRFCKGDGLEVELRPDQRSVYLAQVPRERSIHPDCPALVATNPAAALVSAAVDGAPAIELARLKSAGDGAVLLDETYFPPTVWIGSDQRSAAAAERLKKVCPPSLAVSLLLARPNRVSWPALLVEVLRLLPTGATATTDLASLVERLGDADLAAELTTLFERERSLVLPPTLDDVCGSGHNLRRLRLLQPTAESREQRGAQAHHRYTFPDCGLTGCHLVVMLRADDRPGVVCEITVTGQSGAPEKKYLPTGAGVRYFGPVDSRGGLSVEVCGAAIVVAAFYH